MHKYNRGHGYYCSLYVHLQRPLVHFIGSYNHLVRSVSFLFLSSHLLLGYCLLVYTYVFIRRVSIHLYIIYIYVHARVHIQVYDMHATSVVVANSYTELHSSVSSENICLCINLACSALLQYIHFKICGRCNIASLNIRNFIYIHYMY